MKKKSRFSFSLIAKKILCAGLPLIAIYFIYILISVIKHKDFSTEVLIHIYNPQLEYVFASLVILIISSLLFDITAKELNTKK